MWLVVFVETTGGSLLCRAKNAAVSVLFAVLEEALFDCEKLQKVWVVRIFFEVNWVQNFVSQNTADAV